MAKEHYLARVAKAFPDVVDINRRGSESEDAHWLDGGAHEDADEDGVGGDVV